MDVVCIWGATAADSGRGAMFIQTYLWIFDSLHQCGRAMRAARSHWADARRIVDVRHKTEGVGVVAEEVTLNSAHTRPLSASRPITRGSQAASRHPSNHVYRGDPPRARMSCRVFYSISCPIDGIDNDRGEMIEFTGPMSFISASSGLLPSLTADIADT